MRDFILLPEILGANFFLGEAPRKKLAPRISGRRVYAYLSQALPMRGAYSALRVLLRLLGLDLPN